MSQPLWVTNAGPKDDLRGSLGIHADLAHGLVKVPRQLRQARLSRPRGSEANASGRPAESLFHPRWS